MCIYFCRWHPDIMSLVVLFIYLCIDVGGCSFRTGCYRFRIPFLMQLLVTNDMANVFIRFSIPISQLAVFVL